MKGKRIFALMALCAVLLSTAIGCDNRSEIEKDADKAAKKLEGALQ